MKIITKYILKKYLINFLLVLVSLEIFFVGLDYLQNFKAIPDSANLKLLYVLYTAFFTLTLALPLSIVFGWVVTLVVYIKNNEYVAFYSLGATRKDIMSPVFFISSLALVTLILLQMTPLAYSYEQKRKIVNNEYFSNIRNDIFLKYNDNYIYFKKLLPIEKIAEDIHIFKVVDKSIVQVIVAQKAYFQDDKWYIQDAKVIDKPKDLNIDESKLDIRYEKSLDTLYGFKPKILDNVYEDSSSFATSFSIIDAITAYMLLNEQGIKTDKIRSLLYNEVLVPFFIFPILLLIFAYSSLNSRFFNMGKFVSFSVFGTLVIWGVFFILYKFTNTITVGPEITVLLPLILWLTVSILQYKRKINS